MKQNGVAGGHFRMWALAACSMACITAASGQSRSIDTTKSEITVHVYKAGVLSAFGHDHEISAPMAGGTVDVQGRKVELRVNAAALRVQDPKTSEKDRGEVQANMLGSDVLDVEKFKEVRFHSNAAEPAGEGAWKVSGELTLHGETRPVSMEVHEREGRYTGTCRLNITEFGIKPVRIAGGAVKIKDEVQIDFDIQLAR
jgi:polyisoprenoid-binding protein YceI